MKDLRFKIYEIKLQSNSLFTLFSLIAAFSISNYAIEFYNQILKSENSERVFILIGLDDN